MKQTEKYVDLDDNELSFAKLDREERLLVARLLRRAKAKPDWVEFDNFAFNAVADFYHARGLPRKKLKETIPFKITLDLSARLGIAQGYIQPPDYLDQFEDLVLNHFPSRRDFCKATGLSESMVSHVLAGRKELSLESLSKALERIGYKLRIVPAKAKRTG
jgi:hypothetical protein